MTRSASYFFHYLRFGFFLISRCVNLLITVKKHVKNTETDSVDSLD